MWTGPEVQEARSRSPRTRPWGIETQELRVVTGKGPFQRLEVEYVAGTDQTDGAIMNQGKQSRLHRNTVVMLALLAVFVSLAAASFTLLSSPILTAVCTAAVVTNLVHHFFGGTKGSRLSVKTMKFGGGAAVFAATLWFVNDELVKQMMIVTPDSASWIAMDKNGEQIDARVGKDTLVETKSDFFRNTEWDAMIESGDLRISSEGYDHGMISAKSLEQLEFFNIVDMSPRQGISYSGELNSGMEGNFKPTYNYRIVTTEYQDSYNGFELYDNDGNSVFGDNPNSLRSREFIVFQDGGKYFLIFVVRADHQGEDPRAVFGLTQLKLELDFDRLVSQSAN